MSGTTSYLKKPNEHLLSLNLKVGALTCADCVGQLLRLLQCVDCCPLRIFPQLSNQLPVWFWAARYISVVGARLSGAHQAFVHLYIMIVSAWRIWAVLVRNPNDR